MSTRCQVRVLEAGLPWNNGIDAQHFPIMLYHHSDGYPTHMLPKLLEAYQKAIAPKWYGTSEYPNAWVAGRSGKSAAYICSVDPGSFEPEAGNDFHGDIEWFYEIVCVNHKQGDPTWDVRVFVTGPGFRDNPDRDHLVEVEHGDIVALGRPQIAERIEKRRTDTEMRGAQVVQKKVAKKTEKIVRLIENQPTLSEIVVRFFKGLPVWFMFTGEDLCQYVQANQIEKGAPASPDRILRKLRADGKINYVIINRLESMYMTAPVKDRFAETA